MRVESESETKLYIPVGYPEHPERMATEMNDISFYDLSTNFQIALVTQDILQQDVNVMINLVTPDLNPSEGLWRHWTEKDKLKKECLAKAPARLEDGEYVVTNKVEGIGAEYIYNWACVHDKEVNLELYLMALSETFEIANSMNLSSIAVPVFVTDVFFNHTGSIDTDADLASLICDTFLTLTKTQEPLSTLTVKLVICDYNEADTNTIYHAAIKQINDNNVKSQRSGKSSAECRVSQNEIGQEEPSSPSITDHAADIDSTTPSFESRFKNVGNSQWNTQGARPKDNAWGDNTLANHRDDKDMRPKKNIDVYIHDGDLTRQHTDAVVHPTSYTGSSIHLDDAVGQALKVAGGKDFEAGCTNNDSRVQHDVIITAPGDLPCLAVVHVNTSLCFYSADWIDRIRKCLLKAEANEFSSITFPAMGQGADVDKARYFKDALDQFNKESPRHLDRIHIVLQGNQSVPIYQNIILGSSMDTARRGQNERGTNMPVYTSRNQTPPQPTVSKSSTYKRVKVVVKQGDITHETGGCIVHGVSYFSNFNKIPLYDAVGQALLKSGGEKFEEACSNKELPKGGSVITTGGQLQCKNILHKDIQEYQNKNHWDEFLYDCLVYADSYGSLTINFPLVGASRTTDIVAHSKHQMMGVTRFIDNKTSSSSIKEIRFVIYRHQKAFESFCDSLQVLGTTNPDAKGKSSAAAASASADSTNCVQIGSIKLEVVQDDIAKNQCDMIVHGTHHSFNFISLDDSVGRALKKCGNPEFKAECKRKEVKPAKYTITGGHMLPCKKVLHIDVANITDNTTWKQRLNNILLAADNEQVTSLAIPPFGASGGGKESWGNMAVLIKETIHKFVKDRSPKYLHTIQIVIFKHKALYNCFLEAISSTSGKVGKTLQKQRGKITIKGYISSALLEIEVGNLTLEKTDAIVHPTNSTWSFSHTVIGSALIEAGGKILKEARDKGIKNGLEAGKMTGLTVAGKLKSKHVIHLDITSTSRIEDWVYACLVEARNSSISSISFPALGTGKMGKDPNTIANEFKKAIQRFYNLHEQNTLSLIRIVIFDKSMKDPFIDVLEGLHS